MLRRGRRARLLQSRATAAQAEKKIRQLEKVIDDGEQKLTELLDEVKEAHDEERRMNAEITKLRLQLDETNAATEFAKKDCKKLTGATIRSAMSTNNNYYFVSFSRSTIGSWHLNVFCLSVCNAVHWSV